MFSQLPLVTDTFSKTCDCAVILTLLEGFSIAMFIVLLDVCTLSHVRVIGTGTLAEQVMLIIPLSVTLVTSADSTEIFGETERKKMYVFIDKSYIYNRLKKVVTFKYCPCYNNYCVTY